MDIVEHILSYNENLKPRNGKYMGQISKTDKRYELLHKIPRKIYTMDDSRYGYFVRVNELLTIKIYTFFFSLSIEFEYYFWGRNRISYTPK
jgi:hypothetical protein